MPGTDQKFGGVNDFYQLGVITEKKIMMSEEIWEVDPRSRWKNHCIVEVDGEKYSIERWKHGSDSRCYSVLVHRYNFDERAPYSETVIGAIEFGRHELETVTKSGHDDDGAWAYKAHSSVSKYEEIFIEIPHRFDECFETDILATSEDGPSFKYADHIKKLLSARSERLRAEAENES